ncbi:MAG: hypothetical protein EXS48_03400 [Candidatus Staskawiczbacteria bacterium]|nr:hypothetical protein [Candidatus Staskawiczbacteria bacterium]
MDTIFKWVMLSLKLIVVALMCQLFYLTLEFRYEPDYWIIVFSMSVIILGTIFDFFFKHWAMERFPRLRGLFWMFIIFHTLVFVGFAALVVWGLYLGK